MLFLVSVCTGVSASNSTTDITGLHKWLGRSLEFFWATCWARLYKRLDTGALGAVSRHQSGKVHICWQRSWWNSLCLMWVTRWWTAPYKEEAEPDRVGHFLFLLKEVVLRPYSGFPFVGVGLLVTEVKIGLWWNCSHISIRILIWGRVETAVALF